MIFCGPAKKVTIRLFANDATSAPICEALLAFLCPKDVCCLQISFPESAVEIRFLARKGKVDALMDIAKLIAPTALIYLENATILHAASDSRTDLMHERAVWESVLPAQTTLAVKATSSGSFGEEHRRSASQPSRGVSSAEGGGGTT